MFCQMSKLVTPRLVAVCVCVNERAGRVQVGTCSWRLLLTRFELCSEIRKCDVCVFPRWISWCFLFTCSLSGGKVGTRIKVAIVLLELMFPLYQVTNCQIVQLAEASRARDNNSIMFHLPRLGIKNTLAPAPGPGFLTKNNV